jgi:hypothetical protein
MVDERWTAAALSIGLLPFFIGVPLVLILFGAAFIARRLDPRTDAEATCSNVGNGSQADIRMNPLAALQSKG